MGAKTLVVPGNFPIGCFPLYLTTYGSDKEEYDPITGCLTKLNEFAEYHNKMLQTKLNHIRELNPKVTVIYADYYNAVMQIYHSPYEYGFQNETLKACCGCGGPFNFDSTMKCGDLCKTVCDEPNMYVSWDGVHLTEGAYKLLFKSLFQGSFTTPEFYSVRPTSTSQAGVGLSSSI
ncbi:putative sinapine esterase [Helianthus debilis subsp. tardiflorus]